MAFLFLTRKSDSFDFEVTLFRAELIFYSQKWYWAIPKTVAVLYLTRETFTIYRMILFYVTTWWIA